MFPYTEKYTESEYDIKNNNLLYKIDQQHQNTFENLGNFEKKKASNYYFVYCINGIIHILQPL